VPWGEAAHRPARNRCRKLRKRSLMAESATADKHAMELTQCPYDSSRLDARAIGDGLLLVCTVCDAAWETHGGWVGRVRRPDRAKVIEARRNGNVDKARSATVRGDGRG
jgi:hypothetical protein